MFSIMYTSALVKQHTLNGSSAVRSCLILASSPSFSSKIALNPTGMIGADCKCDSLCCTGPYAASVRARGVLFHKGGFYFHLNGCGLHKYHINSCV
jgi:hypothetical protein